MGGKSQQWKDTWRRFGATGFVVKAALKASEHSLGLSVEAQYSAPLDSVRAALAGVDVNDEVRIRILKGSKPRLNLLTRIHRLHSRLSANDLAEFNRIALAEIEGELVGYWCFKLREGNLYERGVALREDMRGRGLARRLLSASIQSLDADLERGRLMATSDFFNRSSRRMLERCGLQLDGVMTQGRVPLTGHFHVIWKPIG